jgi:N6-adenosine-specific RNA methylase IME4
MKVDIFNTDKKYQIIYADPPWTYRVWSGKGKTAANHYSCMKKEEIFELPVSEIADDNCILFLWVTFPCLKEGLQTIEKWDFAIRHVDLHRKKRTENRKACFGGLGIGQEQTQKFV